MQANATSPPVTEDRRAWRGVFDTGVIASSTKSSAIGAWIFAIVWNAITVPAVVLGFNNARQHWDQRLMVLLIFPLCGLLMLVNAIVQTRRAFKFGRSTLTLAPLPAHPAETLRAIVDTSSALPIDAECVADLQCIRQTSRPYNNRSGPIDEIVWQDDHPVSIVSKGIASRIETEFDLPPDAQPTGTIDLLTRIYRRLIVHAQVPGIDYRETFELPVFSRQPGDAQPIVRVTPPCEVSPAISLASELSTQRIWLQQFAGGSLQIELPPARHLGNILIIALFAVIFDAATVFLAFSDWFAKFMSIRSDSSRC